MALEVKERKPYWSGKSRLTRKRVLGMGHCRHVLAVFLLAFSLLTTSCTSTRITPEVVKAAPKTYQNVAIGEIGVVDELWEGGLPFLRRGLKERLQEKGGFAAILDPVPDTLPSNTLIVKGQVKKVKKGSKALRALIGFGAGSASAAGNFELYDDDGTQLVKFQSKKAYAGGAGIGGFDLVDMDDLMQKLGKETADTIIRWTKGEPLVTPSENQ